LLNFRTRRDVMDASCMMALMYNEWCYHTITHLIWNFRDTSVREGVACGCRGSTTGSVKLL
jgi:hypothetical protein